MTDEPLSLEADPYHELRGVDRDHLLAAALLRAHGDDLPPASTVTETVDRLTGSEPARVTTRKSLGRLSDAGLVERVDGEPDDRARGVRVTETGERVLARGAARLDAAATVEGGR